MRNSVAISVRSLGLAICGLVLAASSGAQVPFDDPVFYATPASPSAVAVADFDGDGNRDILVLTTTALRILSNDGFGSFTARDQASLWSHEAHDVAVADLDRDGDLDLVSANYYSRDVSVLANSGDGSFAPQVGYPAGSFPVDLTQADFDGDQWPDLAVADRDGNAVQVLSNDRSGAYPAASALSVGAGPTRVETGDLNGDLRADLVLLRPTSQLVAVRVAPEPGRNLLFAAGVLSVLSLARWRRAPT